MAGEVTQLRAGAIPGPWIGTLADKVEYVPPIDRGGTRITGLVAGAVPSRYYSITAKVPTSDVGAIRGDTPITKLRPSGPSAWFDTLADKEPATAFSFPVSDTYRVYMSLEPIDEVTVVTTDTYRLSLTLGAVGTVTYAPTDTYRPVLTLSTPTITRSGVTPVFANDTYRPTLTEVSSLLAGEWIVGNDTYIPVLSESSSVEMVDQVNATDTYVPVLYTGFTVTPSTQRAVPVTDTYRVVLTGTAVASAAILEVDQIVGSLSATGVITGEWI